MTTPLTERQRTDRLIDQMMGVAKAREARHELEPLSEVISESPLAGALLALERNAGAHPTQDTAVRTKLISAPQSIEQTGCTFIDSTLLLLEHLKCPPEVRDLVLAICGLTGGDYTHFTKITQDQIGSRLGVTAKTVRERLDTLINWESATNRTVIEIRKQERDNATRHYQITEYRPTIVPFAAEYIRRISARGLPPIKRQQALTNETHKAYEDVASDLAEDMPLAAALIPRKEKNITPQAQKLNLMEREEEDIRKALSRWKNGVKDRQSDPRDYIPQLMIKIEDWLREK